MLNHLIDRIVQKTDNPKKITKAKTKNIIISLIGNFITFFNDKVFLYLLKKKLIKSILNLFNIFKIFYRTNT